MGMTEEKIRNKKKRHQKKKAEIFMRWILKLSQINLSPILTPDQWHCNPNEVLCEESCTKGWNDSSEHDVKSLHKAPAQGHKEEVDEEVGPEATGTLRHVLAIG